MLSPRKFTNKVGGPVVNWTCSAFVGISWSANAAELYAHVLFPPREVFSPPGTVVVLPLRWQHVSATSRASRTGGRPAILKEAPSRTWCLCSGLLAAGASSAHFFVGGTARQELEPPRKGAQGSRSVSIVPTVQSGVDWRVHLLDSSQRRSRRH